MINYAHEIWALIPARGGSKSIPLKNMALLAGRPLIDYAISSAKSASVISRIICSTDNDKIGGHCFKKNIEVLPRPLKLAGDNIATLDVIIHLLKSYQKSENLIPHAIVLLEPTSPFVKLEHIDICVKLLQKTPNATSVQTITEIPPNHHAYNQRYLKDNKWSKFRFIDERLNSFNKQSKPKYYVHGNLRVIRTSSILETNDLFGDYSLGHIISRKYAIDVDGPEDFELAEMYIASGKISI